MVSVRIKEEIVDILISTFTLPKIRNIFKNFDLDVFKDDLIIGTREDVIFNAFCEVNENTFFKILKEFSHPLSFKDRGHRADFVNTLDELLVFDSIQINDSGYGLRFTRKDNFTGTIIALGEDEYKYKTLADRINWALNFFKEEYNKVRMNGLSYEFSLGENIESDQVDDGKDDYEENLNVIKQLKSAGFIIEYEIIAKHEGGCVIWDYALCKIDESKLIKSAEPKAKEKVVKQFADKVIYEHTHTHKFENSIQEKPIDIAVKDTEENFIPKNKNKTYPPKFKPTDWSKITIRFLNEQDVILTVGNENKTTNYEGMGFKDNKSNKPNRTWKVFLELAKNGGKTKPLPTPIPDTIKQHKKTILDNLQFIFKNKSDPFEITLDNEYKLNIKLISPILEKKDNFGVDEYLEENMVSVFELETKEKDW